MKNILPQLLIIEAIFGYKILLNESYATEKTGLVIRSLRGFIKSEKHRVEKSRTAFARNLDRALRIFSTQSLEERLERNPGSHSRRIEDEQLPFITDKLFMAPQPFSRMSTDPFPAVLRGIAKLIAPLYGINSSQSWNWNLAKRYMKLQTPLPDSISFPCRVKEGRSPEKPSSVDRLRPGDIDVIGAIGDSLAAGLGLASTNVIQMTNTNSGLNMFTGGFKNWREIFTVSNMIKEFNPNLVGYRNGDLISALGEDPNLYNVAVLASVIDDFPNMARTFVEKMKRDPRINMEKDWKLLFYFGGSVDFCIENCHWKNLEDAPVHHYRMAEQALDYLRENSPRTLVIFTLPPNAIRIHTDMTKQSTYCKFINIAECPCAYGEPFKNHKEKYIHVVDKIIEAYVSVANHPKYHNKEDFAIVVEHLLSNTTFPKRQSGLGTDFRFLSPDCFHISQRAAAGAANSFWNSLFTPVGQKKNYINWNVYDEILCPTELRPFIATPRNSA